MFCNFNSMFYLNIFVIIKISNVFSENKETLTLSNFMISNIPYTNMLHLVKYNTCAL